VADLLPQFQKSLPMAPQTGLWTDSTKEGRPSEEI
jgi:hypothetical protein